MGVSAFSATPIKSSSATKPPRPEDVVEAQLRYLQVSDVETAYEKYFSDGAKEGTKHSWKTFAQELQDESFQHVIGFQKATVLMAVQLTDNQCSCLVRIVSSKTSARRTTSKKKNGGKDENDGIPLQYWWGLTREEEDQDDDFDDDGDDSEETQPSWKIDTIAPDFECMDIEVIDDDGEDGEVVLYMDEDGNLLQIDELDDEDLDDDDDVDTTGWML